MKIKYSAEVHYGNLFSDPYMVKRFSQNTDFIKRKMAESTQKTHILDIGGYTADTFEFMKKYGVDISKINYTVLDYDETALAIAKKRGASVIRMDFNFESISEVVKGKKFDIVICTEVLEHLLDPARHIKEFPSVLNGNGVAIISLPNENTVFHRIYSLIGMGIDQCAFELYKHLHFPTIRQAFSFVSKYFNIVDHTYYINFGGKRTKFEVFAGFLRLIPDPLWYRLTNVMPGLLARGTIFYCEKKSK